MNWPQLVSHQLNDNSFLLVSWGCHVSGKGWRGRRGLDNILRDWFGKNFWGLFLQQAHELNNSVPIRGHIGCLPHSGMGNRLLHSLTDLRGSLRGRTTYNCTYSHQNTIICTNNPKPYSIARARYICISSDWFRSPFVCLNYIQNGAVFLTNLGY